MNDEYMSMKTIMGGSNGLFWFDATAVQQQSHTMKSILLENLPYPITLLIGIPDFNCC
jgi:hypothetical protein